MSNKLNRDQILREMLETIVKGWGQKAVYDALDDLKGPTNRDGLADKLPIEAANSEPKAVKLVKDLHIRDEKHRNLMLQFARHYDDGTAFRKMSDVKAFLASHHQSTKELRSRDQAFRMLIPIIERMSEKGLLTLISRSRHSGPAELGSISDAIKGAGRYLREPSTDDGINEN